MPETGNGVGGSALYNLLQGARDQNFKATQFAVGSNSSVINSSGYNASDSSDTARMFRKTFGDPSPIDPKSLIKNLPSNLAGVSPGLQSTIKQEQNKIVAGSTKYQYDIFNRLQFGTAPNSPTIGFENTENGGVDKIVSRNSKVDNRVVINYKNYVEVTNADVTGKSRETFLNKIKVDDKFKGPNFKDPSIDVIVANLSLHPCTKISYADFLYCKKLGAYPNNRLVIVRRFFQPVDDNLFDSKFANTQQNPMSVMVNWFDEFPFEIQYGEDWIDHTNGILEEFSNTISSLTPTKKANTITNIANFFKGSQVVPGSPGMDLASPWLKTLWYQFIDQLYQNSGSQIPPNFKNVLTEANPNKIRQAVIKTGLNFTINFNMSFTYVMRYLNGIDPHLAMHNIIANAVRMGTSTSVSIFPKSTQFVPQFVTNLNQGRVIDALGLVFENVSKYLNTLYKKAADTVKNTSVKDIQEAAQTVSIDDIFNKVNTSSYSRLLFSLYRFQLTAAVQADMGLPSGSWHITVGNPFNPIASVGDMVINRSGGMTMKFNNELSYDDKPTEVTFSLSLKNARPRGAQEIEQIFNAGKGRIYVYPQYDDDPDLYLSDTNPTMGVEQSKNNDGKINVKPQ